uniref:Retrotransposon gag domain-containing protein n=1 Tax=Lactuca sativa TaxID=4236 RepID=A0A9R1V9L6_LACSA|nr:hypothetical protein LSAT_V11C600300840 [Lactuca sativa]
MQSLKLDTRFWCTHFPTTLDGNAGVWFKNLAPNSIQIERIIPHQLHAIKKIQGGVREIIGYKQHEGDLIRDHFKRFNEATLYVPGQSDHLVIGAFTHRCLVKCLLSFSNFAEEDVHLRNVYPPEGKSAQKEEGTIAKEAYLKAATSQKGKPRDNYNNNQSKRGYGSRRGLFHSRLIRQNITSSTNVRGSDTTDCSILNKE